MIRRRASAWAKLLERADDELVAALDSLATLLRGGERPESRRRRGGKVAELHKRAWALGLRVALAGDDVVILDPALRDEANQIGGLWRGIHPEEERPAEPAPPGTDSLLRRVDDLKLRLSQLQDRMAASTRERAARRSR